MVPSDSDRLKEAREALEARYTIQRIAELEFRPVQGHFDAAHLKDIHRRIFQDLPSLGFTEVTPGQYRSAVPEGKAWTKDRLLSSINIHSYVTYSLMDNAAQARLDKILERADPHELSKHQAPEFTAALASLYTELDYIHPFAEGNSRTLRVFTKQLAQASGYELAWEKFNESAISRDKLYIARDQGVNTLALPYVQHQETKRRILFSLDQLEQNPNLSDLLRHVIQPTIHKTKQG